MIQLRIGDSTRTSIRTGVLALALFMALTADPRVEAQQAGGLLELSIGRDGEGLAILFTGTLQSAESVRGPWVDAPDAVSPWKPDLAGRQRFYRVREGGGVFSDSSVVEFTLTGPLQEHFDLAFAGLPDGIFPPVREKPYFDATLQMGALEIQTQLRVRGNSSLQECPFPKLKLKINRENREGTPFADAREIKIGTHCAEGGRGTIGRLREQTAAFREVLAYEVMNLMGFIAPRTRRARIEYRDASAGDVVSSSGWQVVREGFIYDHVEVVAERMGGRALEDEEVAALSDANFDSQLIADLRLFHALMGNWDYALSADGRGLWNTEVIELADGRLVPVAGDFDLASWVTGVVRVTAPRDYFPDLEDLERQSLYDLEQILGSVEPANFQAGIERFLSNRTAIEALVAANEIDEEGRENAMRHVEVFFQSIENFASDPRDGSGK